MFKSPVLTTLLATALVSLLSACSKPAPQAPPSIVTTEKVQTKPYQAVFEYVGRLQAVEDTSIQAQVTGYMKEFTFVEGDIIKKGDLLFVIDPAPFKAALANANAQVASAKANVEISTLNYNRGKALVKTGAISQSDFDTLTANRLEAEASLASASANVETANINLEWTRIEAPIDGRIGNKKYSIGDLISPTSGALTSIVSIDPIYAFFQINESTYLQLAQNAAKAEASGQKARTYTAGVKLTNGQVYPHEGEFDFVSNRIDADTDTLTVRATFPNPNGLLRPGQYVRVLVESNETEQQLTVPQSAIVSNQQGNFVYSVSQAGVVTANKVDLGTIDGERQFVKGSNLKDQQSVIVGGLQRVRPGQTVQVKPNPEKQQTIPSTEEQAPAK
ncbi:Efflux pump periplasmic linker BepF [BD1-7 clade bacterium]|uniref:Efflux pump periplasmic linker BepF n=1 Tax=BD1-7 clade bacterium TaxID=2029982 RepID=A0A5S9QD41_9GAMM|nr:Efflux pump periplasmic linker BepF [BD1-7 clade bacterium]